MAASFALLTSLLVTGLRIAYALSIRQVTDCTNGSYTTPIGLNFEVYCSTAIATGGSALGSGTVANWTECMDSCSDSQPPVGYQTCRTAVYREEDSYCWLMDGNVTYQSATPENGWRIAIADASQFMIGSLECPFPNLSTQNTPNGMPFQIHCGQDAVYGDVDTSKNTQYTPQHVTSLQDCMNICSKGTPLCHGVAYNADLTRGYHNCYIKTADVTDHITDSALFVTHLATLADYSIDVDCDEGTYIAANGKAFNKRCKQAIDSTIISTIHTANLEACIDYCAMFTNGSQTCTAVRHQPKPEDGWENCYLQAPAQFYSAARGGYNMALLATPLNSTNSSNAHGTGSPTNPKSSNKAWIAGVVIGPLAVFALLVGGIVWFRKRKQKKMRSTQMIQSDVTNYHEKSSHRSDIRHEMEDTHRDHELDSRNGNYELSGTPVTWRR